MAKTTIKDVVIDLDEKQYLEKFIELVSDALAHVEFFLNYKLGSIKIRIFGEKDVVNESVLLVKSLNKMFNNSIRPDNGGFYLHHLKLIQQTSLKIVSLEGIKSVLEYSGYPSSLDGPEIRTTANLETINGIVDKSYEILMRMPREAKGKVLKRVLLTVCYSTGLSCDFVLEKGLENKYFRKQKDKIVITMDPELCIKGLLSDLTTSSAKKEYAEYIDEEDQSMFGQISFVDKMDEK